MSLVEIENLTKTYGSAIAVDAFDSRAESGQILAVVGPDGAGKTSLFRSMCGLIKFDSGEVTIGGYRVTKAFDKIKPLLGYMPQSFSLYPDLSVEENLRFYAGLFGLSPAEFQLKKKPLYDFSALGPYSGRRAGLLSGGMKQKLALCCALIHDPRVLVLDEPTTGVDPLSRRQFWDILKNLRNDGSSIIVATPYMDEVLQADRAVFMYQGRKLAEGTPEKLTGLYMGKVYRVGLEPTPELMRQIEAIDGISARRFGATIHMYADSDDILNIRNDSLVRIGVNPEQITAIEPDLEDTFIQLMGA